MRIVVGVDGSTSALDAVHTATLEAARRKADLRIVHAFIWPLMNVPLGPSPSGPPHGGLRNEAERILTAAAETALVTDPAVKVTTALVTGAPAAVLLAEAGTADLIVVGDRGLGAIAEILVGSVALQVAERSPVPVLVVKGRARRTGPVVVGLDGTAGSALALTHAFAESERRGAVLIAAHVKDDPVFAGEIRTELVARPAMRPAVHRLHGAVIDAEHRRSGVIAREEVLVGDPGKALVERASDAQLIVVGANSRNGFLGMFLGSVSRHVLRHAPCPVLIVPTPHTDT